MSLEQFISPDQGEGMSEAAFEALRERMAAAAAQIAAIKKEEGKQKKQEDELLKILLKFVKTSSKTDLVLLISRVLEQNIPANFILSIIVLSNPEIHGEVGHFKVLDHAGADESAPQKNALIFFSSNDDTLPLKVKIALDNWMKNLLLQAEENPQKLIKTAYEIEMRELPKEWDFEDPKYERIERVQPVLVQIITSVMREFLEQNNINEPFEKLYDFAKFIITGILNKTKENLDGRKLLH
ncbi:MAG: hypothetical protein NTZ25_03105 [Candidatus Peregrinibacteria bacterium]|nr:hypothetical protein [Candidatus Peregrinibacteria bacterium]